MGRTKEEKLSRKEAKVAEWRGVFSREYEMARAYGSSVERAAYSAQGAVNTAIRKDWDAVPQDRGFYVDCKFMVLERLKDVILKEEGATV